MKKQVLWFVAAIIIPCGILYALESVAPVNKEGVRVDPGILNTIKDRWVVVDTTTSTGTEPSDIDATTRGSGGVCTYQALKALIGVAANGDDEIAIYDIPRNWNNLRIRCAGITNNSSIVYAVYLGDLGEGNKHSDGTSADCELTYVGLFTWTVGTQASTISTYEMCDTLVYTDGLSPFTVSASSPIGERIAEAFLDVKGSDILVAVPTTAGCDAKLLVKGY